MMTNTQRKKIIIANRGEIAIRAAKAIRELGHISIGLWTDNEKEAPHLAFCDEWVHLSGVSHAETFLNEEKLIKLAKENQADALYPGYGFLSENAHFASELKKNGIIFIGPHAEAIKSMGDKAVSKKIAEQAGVPVVPGSVGEVESIEEALNIASDIEYPVLLKAVAGGGGKGMRVCENPEELKVNFERVKSESLKSFGYDGLLVEKFIVNPHHIEVQILADQKGNVFHFFERECSIQRRHQKILEEAPSPFIGDDEKLREKICHTAVMLAQAVEYNSAGTVEFIMGEDKQFYFLEMNTRLQVEHPVTEEITGVDLMTNMIKSAFGESLDFNSQEEISFKGHAIECRICAENPKTLLPAPGVVSGFSMDFPQGTRLDHCLYEGFEITPDFDPMVGKLITYGFNRKVAINKMRVALEGLQIDGLVHNIPLHKVIIKEKNFLQGSYTTNYMNEVKPHEDMAGVISSEDILAFLLSLEKGSSL